MAQGGYDEDDLDRLFGEEGEGVDQSEHLGLDPESLYSYCSERDTRGRPDQV